MSEGAGWLWAVVDIAGVVVLAAALAYGIMAWRNRRKDATTRRIQDEVTRENYNNPKG